MGQDDPVAVTAWKNSWPGAKKKSSSPIRTGLATILPGDPGDPGAPGDAPVFLDKRELKKLAKTPSPDGVVPAPLGSNFLFGDST